MHKLKTAAHFLHLVQRTMLLAQCRRVYTLVISQQVKSRGAAQQLGTAFDDDGSVEHSEGLKLMVTSHLELRQTKNFPVPTFSLL